MYVIANYNWKGELTGYRKGNTFIPPARGNREYNKLIQELEKGTCEIKEPGIDFVIKTYDENGVQTGFRTNLGFVPLDENNHLYKLVKKAIDSSTCQIKEANSDNEVENPEEKIHEIIFCIFFDKPWPHIKDRIDGKLAYKSNKNSKSYEYAFRLSNVPLNNPPNATDYFLKKYSISNESSFLIFPLRAGILEIIVPMKRLQPLFRGEFRNLRDNFFYEFLNDSLSEHLIETGRTKSKGPNLNWLINNAKNYLQHFIQEIGNRIIQIHLHEYGGLPIGYIDKWMVLERTITINRRKNETYSFGAFSLQGERNFNLTGENHYFASKKHFSMENTEQNKNKVPYMIRNIQFLLKSGLHMEAICLLNAVVEVVVKEIFLIVPRFINSQIHVGSIKHRKKIEILENAIKNSSDGVINNDDFLKGFNDLHEIYTRRNEYLHDLKIQNDEIFLSIKERHIIENLISRFIDPADNWFSLLFARWTDPANINSVLREIMKHHQE